MTGDTCELCGIVGSELRDGTCEDRKACNIRRKLNKAVASDLQRAALIGEKIMNYHICKQCGVDGRDVGTEIMLESGVCFDSRGCAERSRAALIGDEDFAALLAQCGSILGSKGRDYTAGSANKLANFDDAAAFLGLEPRQVLGVYLYKHMASVLAYCQHGTLESEPIASRLADVINYCLLLHKMSKRDECDT